MPAATGGVATADFYYRGHDRATALDRLASANLLAVDVETVSLNDLTMVGVGIYISPTEGFYFPAYPNYSEHIPMVMGLIADHTRTKIMHNGANFDLPVLDQLAKEDGYEAPDDTAYEDTSIWGQCAGLPGALQRVGTEWLHATDLFSIQDLFKESNCKSMLGVPEERTATKCLNDCRTTYALYEYLGRTTSPAQRDCYNVDRQLVSVLRVMQAKGLGLRQGLLKEHADRLQKTCDSIRSRCEASGLGNPGSPSQVGYFLASRGNILPIRKGKIVTDEEALEALSDPMAASVLEYRKNTKLIGTYVTPWQQLDRARTHFRMDLATGRLASGKLHSWDTVNRSLHTVPPDMREVFSPDNGIWTWADHGQIELRILAALTHDPVMLAEYAKPKPDLHAITAAAGGVTRDQGKTGNFSFVYGASNNIIHIRAGMPMEAVVKMRAGWNNVYSVASKAMSDWQYNHDDCVESAFGRKMRLPEMHEGTEYNYRAFQSHVGKCSINYRIQGTAADIMKRGMLWLVKQGLDLRLSLHDEYLIDGPWLEPNKDDPAKYAEHPLSNIHPEIRCPFEVKAGLVWS